MPDVKSVNSLKGKDRIIASLFLLSAILVIVFWPGILDMSPQPVIGIIVVVAFIFTCYYLFIFHFRNEILGVIRKSLFLVVIPLAFFVLTRLVLGYSGPSYVYLVPFPLIPIIVRMFYGARLAMFSLLITALLSGFLVPDPFSFLVVTLLTGFAAIFSLSDINRKARVFFSVLTVVITYFVVYTAFSSISADDSGSINRDAYFSFLINGLLILLAYPLIFVFEKRFYFLSDTTLLELCDTNQPLLRKLAEKAPGSYHHSLQVAILAEEAARAIGANILVARAGALYHDIGKIVHPEFYIENQSGETSPHNAIDPLKSASIIIGHINEGVKIGRKYNLPVQIIDFIRTHHGTTKAWYFYKKYMEAFGGSGEPGDSFVYPGPRPFTREMAIIMMADAVEASSHTLDKYSDFNISELVERILIIQEQDDQFSDAPLTYRDLTVIRKIFKKELSNIYHTRIIYPDRIELNG